MKHVRHLHLLIGKCISHRPHDTSNNYRQWPFAIQICSKDKLFVTRMRGNLNIYLKASDYLKHAQHVDFLMRLKGPVQQ